MNPSEVFGDIMIDYSYVECSSACITALKGFAKALPGHRSAEIINAIEAGRRFIKSIQRTDGSWYGSWAVCFTYGSWFGIEGLIAAGEDVSSDHIQRAIKFILSKQNPNGGWGENYLACVNKEYPPEGTGEGLGEDSSGVVQTAWALLGLLAGDCEDKVKYKSIIYLFALLFNFIFYIQVAINRGIDFLRRKQLSNGDWEQEGITGIFNRSCGITYTAYRNTFPMWALLRYANKYEKNLL